MWSPIGSETMQSFYPGDAYVDLVGLSVFGLQSWDQAKYNHDRTFAEVLTPKYKLAQTFGKPIVVAELGYSGNAAYVANWENAVRQTGRDFPNLVGVVYFNFPEVYDWPDGFGKPNWRINGRVTQPAD
jgi:endoglucanase